MLGVIQVERNVQFGMITAPGANNFTLNHPHAFCLLCNFFPMLCATGKGHPPCNADWRSFNSALYHILLLPADNCLTGLWVKTGGLLPGALQSISRATLTSVQLANFKFPNYDLTYDYQIFNDLHNNNPTSKNSSRCFRRTGMLKNIVSIHSSCSL